MTIENQDEAVVTAPESEVTAAPETVETNPPEEQEPKTFTQEELDAIVAKRVAKERRKVERELREAAQVAQRPTTPAQPPRPEDFPNPLEFADKLADWKADQKIAEREAQQHQRQVVSSFADREEEARAKYEDYDEVAKSDDVPITREMAAVILESEIGPEVAYHLGKNPREAARIAQLSPLAQAREIGKIEAALTSATPPVKKTSSAPEPIRPVGSRSTVPTVSTSDPRSTKMSDSEWIKQRNAEIAKRLT